MDRGLGCNLGACPTDDAETMKLSTVLTATASAMAVATIGYAVYFDYKRRNDPAFRKKLRKQSKQSIKVAKKEMKAAAQQENMMIEKAVRDAAEPGALPTGVQEKEAFFMEQVATGEALFAQGPAYHVPAAIAFFKALKVYPAPVELVMIYQKAVPKEVFDLIMKLVTRDAAVNGAGGSAAAAHAEGGAASSGLDQVDDAVDQPNKQGDAEKPAAAPADAGANADEKSEEAKDSATDEAQDAKAAQPGTDSQP